MASSGLLAHMSLQCAIFLFSSVDKNTIINIAIINIINSEIVIILSQSIFLFKTTNLFPPGIPYLNILDLIVVH